METPERNGDAPKRPYVKPAFSWERVFEARALSCGKVGVVGGQCNDQGSPGAGSSS
ncbi:MAG: hypothetical protein ABSC23_02325 [Bryobacteraceae bacterium]|jgi:hypothetical protein